MKINAHSNIANGLQEAENKKLDKTSFKSNEADQSKAAVDLKSSSKVELSERAQMMSKAKAIASDQSIDEAKVARLQKMIDAGEYKVDAEAVADRLVDEHLLTGE